MRPPVRPIDHESTNSRHAPVWAMLFFACAATLLYACVKDGSFSAAVFSVAGLMIGLWLLRLFLSHSSQEAATAVQMFSIVYLVSLIVTFLTFAYYLSLYDLPYESGGTDDMFFEDSAFAVLAAKPDSYDEFQAVVAASAKGTFNISGNYVLGVAAIHKLADLLGMEPSTLNPRIVNAVFLGLTAVLVWRLARRCCEQERFARYAGYLAGLFPGTVFCAAHIYRDVPVGFGLLLIVVLTFSVLDELNGGVVRDDLRVSLKITSLLLSCLVFCSLREGLFVSVATMILGTAAVRGQRWLVVAAGAALLVIGVSGAVALSEFASKAQFFLETYTEYRAESGSASGLGTRIYSLPLTFSLPLRVVYASVNPLPVPAPEITENFRRSGTVVWFLTLPFLLLALRHTLSLPRTDMDRSLQAVAIAFAIPYLQVAIVSMQARHVTMFVPFGCVLIASGMERSKSPIFEKMAFMAILGLILGTVYIAVKGT